jgi:hypothetical protein
MNLKKPFFSIVFAFTIFLVSNANFIILNFNDPMETGFVASGVPITFVDGALKFTIDEANKAWKARLMITVNKDIFANPIMRIRYKIGTIQSNNANLAVRLKIDDRYNMNGDAGTWRINPIVNQASSEWQELKIDLSPLISSWEASNSPNHGNIQEIEIIVGTTNYPFTGKEFFIDHIKIGEIVGVNRAEINPEASNEILAYMSVAVTGTPSKANFSIPNNGVSMAIDSVFFRDDKNLVIKLKQSIDFPRDVMNLPALILSYNGNDVIKDANNILLEAFQNDVSFTAYAENMWKYWGKFEKTNIPFKKPWIGIITVIDGWDWSLPDFVKAGRNANFKGLQMGQLKFSCNNLKDVNINGDHPSWAELEPQEGVYDFDKLRDAIIANSVGYDGIALRLLASSWEVVTYPTPGGDVGWRARKSAPRWMDSLAIAKIPTGNIDGKYQTINMDIMNPEYHNRYIKFITELGKSGIPQMEQLKIVNVCYRSGSLGEEFTPYDPKNNEVEAQYSAEVVNQRTRERLKAWVDAFGDNRHKLMYVGHDEKAQIAYAGELGIGSRHGFIEMYNSYLQMSHFGMTINADRYLEIDENNDFIKKDLPFGDENEEYDNELRFGWKESFAYRYYIASFRMLQMRRNYVMHDRNTLNPELTWYVGLGLDRKIHDTPDAFCLLSEFYISKWANEGNEGPVKNIERWLYQRDVPGYMTTPAMKVPTAKNLWFADNSKPYDFTARKGKKMGFDVDDRMFPAGEQEMAVKVSFYDGVPGTLNLHYENSSGIQTETIVATGADKVRTATFFINSSLSPNDLNFDLELHSEEEVPVFFVRVIKTKEVYSSVDEKMQSNFSLRVSPNPFSDIINLKAVNHDEHQYRITDVFGRKIEEGIFNYSTAIHTSRWNPGIYLLKTNEGKALKLIKR